jgi:methyltransferase (TIGR00027 family)
MRPSEPSRTAVGVATLRAVHQLLDGEPKVLEDPVVLRLLDDGLAEQVRAEPDRFQTPFMAALRTHVVVRSRFAEDRARDAVARGVRQYISLGAGLDTFAYRQPDWAAPLRIVEVDEPASQADKRDRLARAGILVADNVTFAPIDFETTSLVDGLAAHGIDTGIPTFVSWLGVMMYLTREAIDAVFRVVRRLPGGSELVFTFSPPPEETPIHRAGAAAVAGYVAGLGEPFVTHVTPEALAVWLRGHGFTDIAFLTPDAIRTRYLEGRTDGLRVSRRTTVASARV